MTDIISLNQLEQNAKGVYRAQERTLQPFDYSDGEQVERYLRRVFESAADLGSRSPELQQAIIDWPSEYHLSSDRANLLRGLDLSFAKNALELGSGCGAVTRFLGEQGIAVDAVEGSPARAELCRMRCRGLDDVRVINANYNDLELPRSHYDLVLFIGVIEYASKFIADELDDFGAAQQVLESAAALLTEDGAVIVAIENRLGLKYILGRSEDHYAKPFIGIHGYRNTAGIATYSEAEWRILVGEAGFKSCSVGYPFPDYKIPRVILGEEYAKQNEYAFNHLEGIFARDYTVPVKRTPVESVAWEAASQGKFMGQIANSFCLVLGKEKSTSERILNFDFCHMPGPVRKNEFAVVTRKLAGSDTVEKVSLSGYGAASDDEVSQVLTPQSYLPGNLLSTEWLRCILIYARREEFDALLARYYSFLGEIEESGKSLKIDMLPINIVVGADGGYRFFDQEWDVGWKISREYLLFRALLTFIVTNWVHLKDFLEWLELYTVRDFVDYGFRNHHLKLVGFLDEFIRMENTFQQKITYQADDRRVQGLLDTVFDFTVEIRDIYATLLWHTDEGEFEQQLSVETRYEASPEYQQLEFELPRNIGRLSRIRFDPFDIRKPEDIGFFSVNAIELAEIRDGREKVFWSVEGEQEIAQEAMPSSAWFEPLETGGFWMSATAFPKLEFRLPEMVELDGSARHVARVGLRATESREYILAHQQYLVKMRQQEQTEQDLARTLHHLESARTEIADIKAGKPFRLGMKIFSMLSFLKR